MSNSYDLEEIEEIMSEITHTEPLDIHEIRDFQEVLLSDELKEGWPSKKYIQQLLLSYWESHKENTQMRLLLSQASRKLMQNSNDNDVSSAELVKDMLKFTALHVPKTEKNHDETKSPKKRVAKKRN